MKDILSKEDFQVVEGGITCPKGIKAAGVKCGIRFNKKDLALIYSEKAADAWGTFTTNKFKAYREKFISIGRETAGSSDK
jgi:glutamate N-acetyltransferase/amino-acid N-acetyltransferase